MDRPHTQYTRSGELAIAYQAHGSGDHELLMSVGGTSNIGAMWDLPGGERLRDGLLALFTGPGEGVRCAKQVISDARGLGLEVRSGVHTGEVERGPDGVAGLAVHLAARIMALGGASEILVSGTVRDLVIGSELSFAEVGEHELKGVPGRWTIWAAT